MRYVASCEGTYEEFKGLRAVYDEARQLAEAGGIFAPMSAQVAEAALDALTKSVERQCELVEQNGFADGTLEDHYIAAEKWQEHRGLSEEIDLAIDFLQDKLVGLIIEAEIAEELAADLDTEGCSGIVCDFDLEPVNAAVEGTRIEMALTILEDVEFACPGREDVLEEIRESLQVLLDSLQ